MRAPLECACTICTCICLCQMHACARARPHRRRHKIAYTWDRGAAARIADRERLRLRCLRQARGGRARVDARTHATRCVRREPRDQDRTCCLIALRATSRSPLASDCQFRLDAKGIRTPRKQMTTGRRRPHLQIESWPKKPFSGSKISLRRLSKEDHPDFFRIR